LGFRERWGFGTSRRRRARNPRGFPARRDGRAELAAAPGCEPTASDYCAQALLLLPTPTQVERWTSRYRAGDSEAAETLLHHFSPYLAKWLRLLTTGRFDPQDAEVRHFLSMLGPTDWNATAYLVRRRLQAYERADLEQEVQIALLETARAHSQLPATFRFLLLARLKELTRDPLVFRYEQHTEVREDLAAPAATTIDEQWVAGITCGHGFAELTVFERQVLRLTRWLHFSVARTSAVLGVSRRQVERTLADPARGTAAAGHGLDVPHGCGAPFPGAAKGETS
jgi:hypothetical protein